MQDPSTTYQSTKLPQFPTTEQQQEQLKCPRCESTNTKFCYYNNYNLSQPRHFCKNCRRYWTKGGALRNIPVGGGTRKTTRKTTKRSSSSSSSTATRILTPELGGTAGPVDQDRRMLDITGSFSSLLASNGQFGTLVDDGMNSSGGGGGGSSVGRVQFGEFIENLNSNNQASHDQDNFMGLQGDTSCWGGVAGSGNGNGWPDLSIYTPDQRACLLARGTQTMRCADPRSAWLPCRVPETWPVA